MYRNDQKYRMDLMNWVQFWQLKKKKNVLEVISMKCIGNVGIYIIINYV